MNIKNSDIVYYKFVQIYAQRKEWEEKEKMRQTCE